MDNEQFQEFVVQHLMKLDTKVTSLDTKVASLDTKVSSLETKVSAMNIKVSSLESNMSSLENTVTRIETRMEHEIIDKIKVLFDGHQLHEDRFDRIEKKLGIK